ncbi:MAG: TylF/MycF/NovP-related O-methyltransferase [Solirubrobacteraceae bacterium]
MASADSASMRANSRGLRARFRSGLNAALGNGELRARLNRGLSKANFELIVRPPTETLEPEFEQFRRRCDPYTMTSRERMYAVYQATRYIIEADVPGDIVECGVWRGGSSMMAALTLMSAGGSDRRLWLYDTFEGMPEPGQRDVGPDGSNAHDEWERNRRDGGNDWCYSPIDEVRANILSTGLAADAVELVQGRIEETIPAQAPDRIALLRLDTDWYESTHHELVHLFPRLSRGGALLVDDYGHWEGVRAAVDEYRRQHGIHLLLTRTDYAGRMAIKL